MTNKPSNCQTQLDKLNANIEAMEELREILSADELDAMLQSLKFQVEILARRKPGNDDPFVANIPDQFRQRFDKALFDNCTICRRKFSDNQGYVINKIYQNGECIYEVTYCTDCQQTLRNTFSAQSKKSIREFFPNDVAQYVKRMLIMLAGGNKSEFLTRYCIKCKADKNDTPNYHEYAYCEGAQIMYGDYPYMICESCVLQLYNMMSNETRQAYHRFMDEHFGLPPDFYSKKVEEKLILFL